MAVEFSSSVTYALQKLGTPDLVLKPEQRTAINAVYNGRDVFVWLPSKSLCFHTLPFVFDYKLALTDVSAVLVITRAQYAPGLCVCVRRYVCVCVCLCVDKKHACLRLTARKSLQKLSLQLLH